MKKTLVAIDPMNHTMRIVYDAKLETFYLQMKIMFLWTNSEYTFDVERVRDWVKMHRLAWVDSRWKN